MRYLRWDQVSTTKETNELVAELALRHLAGCTSPAATEVERAVRSLDLRTLCSYELDYTDLPLRDAQGIRQALAFFTKRQDLAVPGIDKKEVALAKFMEAEALCSRTNAKIRDHLAGVPQWDASVDGVLYLAQRIIARILGPVPAYSSLKPRFGPGATTTLTKSKASPRSKLGQDFACSEDLMPVANCLMREMAGWVKHRSQLDAVPVVHTGRLSFVPKSAKTHRTVMVEPQLNTMFQLGIGSLMKARLLRGGCDISDQTRNQRLALEGSLTGALATLDLSSASDTVSRELVYHLLPLDWAHFLARFRTSRVEVPGVGLIRLEKFSSMGNGFTFPLETLIFLALARATCVHLDMEREIIERQVSVYGDDIVVPVAAVALLQQVLADCGFVLNKDKSFSSGPFRESCGKDYFLGTDIRPFYLKGPLSPENLFCLHNFYVRTGQLGEASRIASVVPEPLKLWGPDGYGDGHLIGDHPRTLRVSLKERGYEGYYFRTYISKTTRDYRSYKGEGALPSYTIYASSSDDARTCPPGGQIWRKSRFLGNRGRGEPLPAVWTLADPGCSIGYDCGELWAVTPGRNGYKRIQVYVLGSA